ncbi:Rrf2 family transcriptional regulator [Methylophaga nitratireducenticrescens]|uniref:Nitrite-sensitive transcriptional repressor NsrR n=1 Tax=Methylophaga nitratireducenticrescens TaxID=754476 RepID=I1XEV9_METNJ|nr:Rrf2 family transcriptional regulator [Methylophaga nitratireducenticrescens]AFI82928.1 Rrf2 family transcriptional regulator [Methylophaga nitratireducenticrescens]AUZ83115.1 Rrf2 family transcriptional regulator [Methylophaga nitratireducenticrescens]
MRITSYTDYALRVLIYLAAEPGRKTTIREISTTFGISKNHLMKVVNQLSRLGYIDSVRGKNGGLNLHCSPTEVNLGILFQQTETDLGLVECYTENNTCSITPACQLKHILAEAQQAFIDVLGQYSLADLVTARHRPELLKLLNLN